jgi:hypothetical protein
VKPVAMAVDASDHGGDVPTGSKPEPKTKPVKVSVRDTVKAARGEPAHRFDTVKAARGEPAHRFDTVKAARGEPARRFDALGEGEQLAMVGKGGKMQPDKAKNTPQPHVQQKTYVLRISTMGYRQC